MVRGARKKSQLQHSGFPPPPSPLRKCSSTTTGLGAALEARLLPLTEQRRTATRAKKCQDLGFLQQQQQRKCCSKRKKRTKKVEQEQDLSSCLPIDVLMRILALLPVPKLFQLRLVCKSWNSLLRSPAFLDVWSAEASSSSRPECWLVMARKLPSFFAKEFVAYSPSLGKWLRPPLDSSSNISSYFGRSAFRVATRFDLSSVPNVSDFLLASAGGLVCCVVNRLLQQQQQPHSDCVVKQLLQRDHSCLVNRLLQQQQCNNSNNSPPPPPEPPSSVFIHEQDLSRCVFDQCDYDVLVINPLTGAVKSLPKHPKHHHDPSIFICMFANSATNSYHVVLWNARLYDMGLRVYDSKSSSWKVGQAMTAATLSPPHVRNGDLFRYDRHKAILFAYNLESDTWSKMDVLPHPATRGPQILKCKGRILNVSQLEMRTFNHDLTSMHTAIQGFGVWELQFSSCGTASWVEVARTPPEYWEGLYELVDGSYFRYELNFISHETLICMTGVHYTDFNYGGKYWPPLVYDLALGSWYHLPAYKGIVDFLGLFSFQPSLTAVV